MLYQIQNINTYILIPHRKFKLLTSKKFQNLFTSPFTQSRHFSRRPLRWELSHSIEDGRHARPLSKLRDPSDLFSYCLKHEQTLRPRDWLCALTELTQMKKRLGTKSQTQQQCQSSSSQSNSSNDAFNFELLMSESPHAIAFKRFTQGLKQYAIPTPSHCVLILHRFAILGYYAPFVHSTLIPRMFGGSISMSQMSTLTQNPAVLGFNCKELALTSWALGTLGVLEERVWDLIETQAWILCTQVNVNRSRQSNLRLDGQAGSKTSETQQQSIELPTPLRPGTLPSGLNQDSDSASEAIQKSNSLPFKDQIYQPIVVSSTLSKLSNSNANQIQQQNSIMHSTPTLPQLAMLAWGLSAAGRLGKNSQNQSCHNQNQNVNLGFLKTQLLKELSKYELAGHRDKVSKLTKVRLEVRNRETEIGQDTKEGSDSEQQGSNKTQILKPQHHLLELQPHDLSFLLRAYALVPNSGTNRSLFTVQRPQDSKSQSMSSASQPSIPMYKIDIPFVRTLLHVTIAALNEKSSTMFRAQDLVPIYEVCASLSQDIGFGKLLSDSESQIKKNQQEPDLDNNNESDSVATSRIKALYHEPPDAQRLKLVEKHLGLDKNYASNNDSIISNLSLNRNSQELDKVTPITTRKLREILRRKQEEQEILHQHTGDNGIKSESQVARSGINLQNPSSKTNGNAVTNNKSTSNTKQQQQYSRKDNLLLIRKVLRLANERSRRLRLDVAFQHEHIVSILESLAVLKESDLKTTSTSDPDPDIMDPRLLYQVLSFLDSPHGGENLTSSNLLRVARGLGNLNITDAAAWKKLNVRFQKVGAELKSSKELRELSYWMERSGRGNGRVEGIMSCYMGVRKDRERYGAV